METKNRKLSLLSIYFTFALDTFGIGIIYPIFTPLFLNTKLHFFAATDTLFERTLFLGILIALFPFSQFFGAPLIGDFSDRIGRKKAFIITITGSILGYIITTASIAFESLFWLLISRLICGFFAGNTTICLATLSDLSADEKERSKNFGMISAFGGLSFFCAIFIGGFFSNPHLDTLFSPALPFAITGFLFASNLILMLLSFTETHQVPSTRGFQLFKGFHNIFSALKIPKLKNCYLIYFFFVTAWMSSMQFFPTILLNTFSVSPNLLTISFLGVGLIWSLSNLIIQRFLAKRYSPEQVLSVIIPLLSLVLLSCLLANTYYTFIVHYGLAVALAALSWSNILAYVSLNASLDVQGRILGINQSFGSIASILGAILGGFIAAIHPKLVLLYSTLLCIFALWVLRKNFLLSE
jgi:MFS transporter, DHA1 family, tetracycline resistance protein